MAGNYVKVHSVTMTSGATLSSALNLTKPYEKMFLQVPSMASGDLYIQASFDGVTFKRVTQADPNQATDFKIASAASNRVVPLPVGYQHLKIESSSGCTDVVTTYKLICAD